MPATVQHLEDEFDVTATAVDDPAQTANIVVIVGKRTPNLRAPVGS